MNSNYEKKLGQKIRSIRESQHMTQEQLAARLQLNNCDITRSALAKIEVGQRHIYPDEIFLFRKIFHVTYDELFPNDI